MIKHSGGLVTLVRPLDTDGVLLMSDLHIGAASVDYGRIEQDLRGARTLESRILINGDVFDHIVPHDKRYAPSALHPRLQGKDEIANEALDWAEELLGPYAHLIDLIGIGNHDHVATRTAGLDLVRELVRRLNHGTGAAVAYGGYTGVITYKLKDDDGHRDDLVIHYHHGAGKAKRAGPAIASLQSSVTVGNADVVWQGHYHVQATTKERVVRANSRGRLVERDKAYILTGSYMRPYQGEEASQAVKGRRGNYAADANFRPGGVGSTRLSWSMEDGGLRLRVSQ